MIIAGGQTGVDRAALDAALELGVPCAGWCPRGRYAEDGVIPSRYPLREAPTPDYAERTYLNVRDSDATLILTWGVPTGGTAYTVACARQLGKPYLVVDMAYEVMSEEIVSWILHNGIQVLNVAGPRESSRHGTHAAARDVMRELLRVVFDSTPPTVQ